MIHLLILLFPFFYYGRAQQTLYPAAIPLAVRSPYLSCWMSTANGTNIADMQPTAEAFQLGNTTQFLYVDVWLFCPWNTTTVTKIDCTLDRQHSCPCPCRQYNLLLAGISKSHQHNFKPHQHCNFTYPDPAHYTSWTHAIST